MLIELLASIDVVRLLHIGIALFYSAHILVAITTSQHQKRVEALLWAILLRAMLTASPEGL